MIDQVQLVDADGVRLAAAFIAPIATLQGDNMLLGENTTYPPSDLNDERVV